MKQPKKRIGSNKTIETKSTPTKKTKKKTAKKKANIIKEFGTSKLELNFAKKFLKGVNFVYQFKAEDIGRYYDFAIVKDVLSPIMTETCGVQHIKYCNGMSIELLIEVDGDYYHSNPELYKEEDLNKLQLRNRRNDEKKNEWASYNGIPLLRFWESDIKNNPKKIVETLKRYIKIDTPKKHRKNGTIIEEKQGKK